MTDSYRLQLETQAAARLRERIVAEYGEDAELIRDMVEGETRLHDILAAVTFELAAVEGEKDGIEAALGKMRDRLTRKCNRASALREAISTAMGIAELSSLKTAAATVSMRPSPPRVEITDSAALPAIYVTQPAPVPDKRAIGTALKDGQDVPGAVLSNQPPALSVRFT